MEASTLQPPASLAQGQPRIEAALAQPQPRIALAGPLLRLRSDEQLVALFRAGHDEAFRVIHDRYHKRLFAYARQMLPARQDAEDALQDVFVRAYSGLRASDRDLALRAWLFRVAHNRCIDELRKPPPPPPEVLQLVRPGPHDPLAEVDLRESLRRLVEDIRRLPEQQRSALLMRELAGMSYAELASSLGVSVGAVKSLLVRARLGLAQAAAARDTACVVIREQLVEAHDRGVRPSANTRKHVRDCSNCKSFRHDLRGVSRQLAATSPAIGPLGFLAKLVGISGGGGAAGGAGGGVALLSGGGTTASAGGLALSTGHVATVIVAAMATAGGAVEIQHTIVQAVKPPAHVRGHAGTGHRLPASLSAGALPASSGAAPDAVATDPPPGPVTSASSSAAAAKRSATPEAATDHTTASVVGAGNTVGKRHAHAGSSTATNTTTTTTGSAAPGTCAAPSSSASSSTASAPSTGGSSSTPTTGPSAPDTPSSSAPPATTSACSSTPTSASDSSPSSSSGSATASGSSPSTAGSTSSGTGSGSSATANPGASTGSPQSGSTSSSVATG